ncbi:universal stress protein [Corynebacterium pseudogenitalium]|uniref:universal stress protein n=1 Tax=Corynebacterium pseudogenitalium TaxID=38303 RepID=UPI00210C05BF|nr:universal stress protein [Corynebacterium pseudogenitalium]UUA87156.1 universal stress protein [Corynebacterium pseudogenitalium]
MAPRSFSSELAQSFESERPLRVLVGWDASNSEAIEFAAWLGRSLPVTVRVAASVSGSWTKSLSSKKYDKWLQKQRDTISEKATKALKHELPRSQWADPVAQVLERGSLAECLFEMADGFEADILLLGSKSKTSKGRFRPTSDADEMMHSSPLPLGLAPKGVQLSKKGITRVTYSLIDSGAVQPSFSGLAYATTLASLLDVPLRIIAFSPSEGGGFDDQEDQMEWNEAALGLLDRARDSAFAVAEHLGPEHTERLDVSNFVATGKGWKKAIDSVKWKKGDILCLGSKSSGPLKRVFVGTREGEFIRFAPVPVIVYPRGKH